MWDPTKSNRTSKIQTARTTNTVTSEHLIYSNIANMRLFPERWTTRVDAKVNFNYLSLARMVGAITSKIHILNKSIETSVANAVHILKTTTEIWSF